MSDYTLVNLKDVEDQAKSFGIAGLETRFPHKELGAGVSYQRYEPGTRLPFGHKHEEAEESYIVISGGGRIKLDEEIVELKQWDVLRIPPPVTRAVEAGPDGLELLVVNTFGHTSDTEPIMGWWSD
jgi:mannose-6-phosphate isomerase-like protein (cupin superfamily)